MIINHLFFLEYFDRYSFSSYSLSLSCAHPSSSKSRSSPWLSQRVHCEAEESDASAAGNTMQGTATGTVTDRTPQDVTLEPQTECC